MNINKFKSIIASTESPIKELLAIEHDDIQKFAKNIANKFKELKCGGETLINEGKILKIGVVGQVKAGKSSFLNALMFNGENVLPKASTPMTAGLTVLEYGDSNLFEVEYYTKQEWNEFVELNKLYEKVVKEVRENKDFAGAPENFIVKEIENRTNEIQRSAHELVERCDACALAKVGKANETVAFTNIKGLQSHLNEYVGVNGQYTSVVKSLYIHLNDERLKDIRIVDTPGVNDPIVSRETRTHEFLHSCHGVFFLSSASRFFDSKDISFMNTRIGNKGVGTVVLLASKYDSVLQDLGFQYRGKQQEGNLDYADNTAQRQLRNRFETSRTQLDNPNINILFDTTSGISYSIATKDESDWDPIEKNVVKQMKSFYPDAFITPKEAKDTFLMLANMEKIKTTYLENTFIKDKEAIIEHKMTEYFTESTNEIKGEVTSAIERVVQRCKELDTLEIKDLHEQKKMQEQLFENIGSECSKFIQKFQNELKAKVKELHESIKRPELYSVPTFTKEVSVSHKGWLWGTSTSDFKVKVLDTTQLKDIIEKSVKEYIDNWQLAWRNHFEKGKKDLFDAFCSRITEFSKETTYTAFNDTYYRNLMARVLSDIEIYEILELKDTQDDVITNITNCLDGSELNLTTSYDCKEEGVQGKLDAEASSICNNAKMKIQNYIKVLVKMVKDEADKNAKSTINMMDELKKNIVEKLKGVGEEYIENLEKDLDNKQEIKQKLETANKYLNTIKNYLDGSELNFMTSYDCKEEGVQGNLDAEASTIRNNSKIRIQNYIQDLVNDVKGKADNNAKPTIDQMNELKKNIVEELRGVGKEYIEKLENNLDNKQKIKQKFKTVNEYLNTMRKNKN